MKGFSIKVTVALMALALLSSCAKEEDYYSLNDVWLSLGIIDTSNNLGYDYIVYCDNGDTLLPVANNVPYFEAEDSQRVLINFTILDEVGAAPQKYYVKINNLQQVLLKDPVELTTANSDSLGHDSITINNLWIARDMMNIEFTYLGGIEQHYINLAYTTNDKGQIDLPVELNFRHNANNDQAKVLLTGIVSFRMKNLQVEGQDSISYTVHSTGLLDGNQTFEGSYSY